MTGTDVERQADELKWWLPLPLLDEDDNEDADMDDGKYFAFIFLVAFLPPIIILCRSATLLWQNK